MARKLQLRTPAPLLRLGKPRLIHARVFDAAYHDFHNDLLVEAPLR
jgi:hypothetical protein